MDAGDPARAHKLANEVDCSAIFDQNTQYIRASLYSALLFGAGRLTPELKHSVIAKGSFDNTIAKVTELFRKSILLNLESSARKSLNDAIESWTEAHKPKVTKAEGDDEERARLLQPFVSFREDGDNMLQLISSLHSTRLAGYGFTAEAEVLGTTEYQVDEQLDKRTCPVCQYMHGKVFEVRDARKSLDNILGTTDPEDLRSLQPWPPQDKKSMEEMMSLSDEELVARNWHIPPYHPNCRGLLSHVGEAGELDTIGGEASGADHQMTSEDFGEFGIDMDADQTDDWNREVGIPVGDVLAGLLGEESASLLDQAAVGDQEPEMGNIGLTVFNWFDKDKLVVRSERAMFGAENDVQSSLTFDFSGSAATINHLEFDAADTGKGFGKALMSSWNDTFDRMGVDTINVYAGLDMGGYAWARYGFIPEQFEWDALRESLAEDLTALKDALPQTAYSVLEKATLSNDPKMLWAISDMQTQVEGEPVGKLLLSGKSWQGYLDRKDGAAMDRFNQYVNG